MIKFYEILREFWCQETDEAFEKYHPPYQCQQDRPMSCPVIVDQDMSDTHHQCQISCQNHHALILEELQECLYISLTDKERDTNDRKKNSPELCQEQCQSHKRRLGNKDRNKYMFLLPNIYSFHTSTITFLVVSIVFLS